MSVFAPTALRVSALALLLSGTILAGAAQAEPPATQMSGAPNSTLTMDKDGNTVATPDTNVPGGDHATINAPDDRNANPEMNGAPAHREMAATHHDEMAGEHKGPPSPEMMKAHVEDRIKTLHEKLMITPVQESAWTPVAQAMRDNEAQMSGLIQDRQANHGKLTAVESLNAYERLTQAHLDGLKRVSGAFTTLYNQLSSDQKLAADKVFSEGPMMGGHGGRHHPRHTKTAK